MAKSLKAEQLFFVFCLNGDKGQKGGGGFKILADGCEDGSPKRTRTTVPGDHASRSE
eukprot:COSAG02_NODE_72382_length_186_cov_19.781609_1_plen_56_part_10